MESWFALRYTPGRTKHIAFSARLHAAHLHWQMAELRLRRHHDKAYLTRSELAFTHVIALSFIPVIFTL